MKDTTKKKKKDAVAPGATIKDKDLAAVTTEDRTPLTTNQGQPIGTDQNSLRAGKRGPTLLEDFVLREKIQHFDHERIPERVVHARGAAAHGVFELHESLEQYTTAGVLTDTSRVTPLFLRFSTVAGSRGSADTARDVRGFAVKMYTQEGNWDLVGNNIPVFFIQDAMKFPDLVHAVKPEPNNEIPQASSAHDTFYDFISLTPESMHMIMWVMSDRAIPRSYAMMEGFGVHSFRLLNAQGQATFVKFHWKPVLGAHSLVWDEAVKIMGQDPDFHRRDLWEAIEAGNFPQWDLAVQLLPEADEQKFDFDVLDATKLWPEDLIPLKRIGRMTLNRNPDNFFAETEQVAFMTTNIVPGIDFSNDPLLQGRNFSYLDTQLSRLGTPNFHELPINRPVCPFSNNQRDAQMRTTINKGRVAYSPASLDGHSPEEATPGVSFASSREQNEATPVSGFQSYEEQVSGPKVRVRSESFGDHYGQAKLFWNSMAKHEKEHIVKALQFELSKVETREVRVRMLGHLAQINETMAAQIGLAIGESLPGAKAKPGGTADSPSETEALAKAVSKTSASGGLQQTSGLSQAQGQPQSPKGRKVAILTGPGSFTKCIETMQEKLAEQGALGVIVGPHIGAIEGDKGSFEAKKTYGNSSSVHFDGVYVPGSTDMDALVKMGDARKFLDEAYKHGKPIAASGEGADLVNATEFGRHSNSAPPGVFVSSEGNALSVCDGLIDGLAKHRFRDRPDVGDIAA